ncbi:hypothetical protein ACJX0J_027138 [Zea mays]
MCLHIFTTSVCKVKHLFNMLSETQITQHTSVLYRLTKDTSGQHASRLLRIFLHSVMPTGRLNNVINTSKNTAIFEILEEGGGGSHFALSIYFMWSNNCMEIVFSDDGINKRIEAQYHFKRDNIILSLQIAAAAHNVSSCIKIIYNSKYISKDHDTGSSKEPVDLVTDKPVLILYVNYSPQVLLPASLGTRDSNEVIETNQFTSREQETHYIFDTLYISISVFRQ